MKTYTAKSSAVRAAKAANLDVTALDFIQTESGWSWEEKVSEQDKDLLNIFKTTHCPKCGVHLSNGAVTYENALDDHNDPNAQGFKGDDMITHEYFCLGCGEEFGEEVKPAKAKKSPSKTVAHTKVSTVNRPCTLVWDIAEKMKGARRKDIIDECVKQGVAFYTARTQYQQWLMASRNIEK